MAAVRLAARELGQLRPLIRKKTMLSLEMHFVWMAYSERAMFKEKLDGYSLSKACIRKNVLQYFARRRRSPYDRSSILARLNGFYPECFDLFFHRIEHPHRRP
jgi:hypothetical protein